MVTVEETIMDRLERTNPEMPLFNNDIAIAANVTVNSQDMAENSGVSSLQ